jgi:uncharacterized membrane protein YeaQ/YmgE (transglycosylase-associated protein family)
MRGYLTVDVGGIISALVTGLIIGALARLVLPGKQPIGVLLTIGLGLIGALLGGYVADSFTQNFWVILLVQVAVAAILVAILSAFLAGRSRAERRT